jgi:hypothetical protein
MIHEADMLNPPYDTTSGFSNGRSSNDRNGASGSGSATSCVTVDFQAKLAKMISSPTDPIGKFLKQANYREERFDYYIYHTIHTTPH